jgi:F-type H+-transporting ATPase subunit a
MATRNNLSLIFFKLILFVKDTLKRNLNLKSYPHFIYLFLNFMYILLSNMAGMVAYSVTVTSSLILTLFFSFSYFFGINVYGILLNRSEYLTLFVPSGVPYLILPALYLIELISYFSRVVSLSVRLFANMMSGHALLKILLSFVLTFLLLKSQLSLLFFFP